MSGLGTNGVKEAAGLIEVCLDRERELVHGWERAQEYSVSRQSELVLRRRVPLPRALFEQYSYLECKSFMGIFPEIHRAWFTVDNRLFLWNYYTGSDFYPYEGVDQIITAAAIVEPRPGVFVDDVKFILALSTPVEVILLGVCFSGPDVTSELTLIPTQMIVHTDNIAMLKMVGSKNQRLFMAGRDGCLHELTYKGELDSFWSLGSRKARKLNHSKNPLSSLVPVSIKLFFTGDDPLVDLAVDDSRELLYSLSECGIVTVYDIAKQSKAHRVASANAVADARKYSPSSSARERAFISLATVPLLTSTSIHLVLITSLGERMYYSLRSGRGPIRGLTAIGFRGTPPMHSDVSRPSVHTAFWKRGTLVLADARGGDTDTLIAITPEPAAPSRSTESYRFKSTETSIEVVAETPLDPHSGFARAWAITEAPSRTARQSVGTEAPKELIVLTNSAIQLYVRMEPRDQLEKLLASSGGVSEADLRHLFSQYGAKEVCAMCLAIITEKDMNANVIANATRVFYSMGGEPSFEDADDGLSTYTSRGPQFDIGRPSSSLPPLRFSGSHDGFCLHIARVVNPVWFNHVTSSRNPDAIQSLNLTKELMLTMRERLLATIAFLDKNTATDSKRGDAGANPVEAPVPVGDRSTPAPVQDRVHKGSAPKRRGDEAKRSEQVSMGNLMAMTERTAETLALLSLLSDHQFPRLAASLTSTGRQELARVRFCELVVSDAGSFVCSALLEALFTSYADEPNVVDALCETLRNRAKSFFGDAEVTVHRGLSLIRQAARTQGPEAAVLAADAVRELKPHAGRVVDLPGICAEIRSAGAITAMAELIVASASAAEANGDSGLLDSACQCTFDTLQGLMMSDDRSVERQGEAMIKVLLDNPSEVFGERLYMFLVELGPIGAEELFKFPSVRVEKFLERNDIDLLWRYFAKQGRHVDAAVVLMQLAEDSSSSAPLSERVSYLASAVHNAKVASAESSDARAASLLREVGDKLDVAQVQLRVVEELKWRRSGDPDASTAMEELNSSLMDLSTLYNKYARPWELWESELDALRCASYRDDELVKRLWTEIVDAELHISSDSPSSLRARMVTLGRDFHPSATSFPVDFLVELLERRSIERRSMARWNEARGWVASTMLQIGVARRDIISAYSAILERGNLAGEQPWDNSITLYIIQVVEKMMMDWIDAGRKLDSDRRELETALSTITKLISSARGLLRTMTEAVAANLLRSFDSLEIKCDKLTRQS